MDQGRRPSDNIPLAHGYFLPEDEEAASAGVDDLNNSSSSSSAADSSHYETDSAPSLHAHSDDDETYYHAAGDHGAAGLGNGTNGFGSANSRRPSQNVSTTTRPPPAHPHPPQSPQDGAAAVDDGADADAGAERKALVARQKDLRKQIVEIQQNPSWNAAEKARKIQSLMSSNYKSLHTNTTLGEAGGGSVDAASLMMGMKLDPSTEGAISPKDRIKTWHDRDSQILGCKHYQRGARLQARCCGKWFTCRFCHDEVSDHTLNRSQTTTMLCMHCLIVQPAAQNCAHCQARMSEYYCTTCKLWDDDRTKHIYHCNDCGICRIGRGLGVDYFHCDKCNACMAIGLDRGNHKCIERNLECDCPICGEYMFTSTSTVIFMPCGHCIHYTCHQTYIQTSYQCPTCFKSLSDMTDYFARIDTMLAQHTMPAEYANMTSHLYCNDCEQRSDARYHFLYHKCAHCKGYNTRVLGVERAGVAVVEEAAGVGGGARRGSAVSAGGDRRGSGAAFTTGGRRASAIGAGIAGGGAGTGADQQQQSGAAPAVAPPFLDPLARRRGSDPR
ncbi:hypothetical protein HDU90_002488 [Geranomyces variabilis]|nr:hypothetical protein HDU90_002488 [Geranomyces variabilis]